MQLEHRNRLSRGRMGPSAWLERITRGDDRSWTRAGRDGVHIGSPAWNEDKGCQSLSWQTLDPQTEDRAQGSSLSERSSRPGVTVFYAISDQLEGML